MMVSSDLDRYLPSIAAGDGDAFADWLAGAEATIRRSLRTFASQVDVEAVVQEALFRVWEAAVRVVPDGKPNALLRVALRSARNLAISEVRRTRSQPEEIDELERRIAAAEKITQPVISDPLLRAVIERCREELPAQPAKALAARLDQRGGETDQTLAERCDMHLNTFLQNVTRARKHLLECLKRNDVDLEVESA